MGLFSARNHCLKIILFVLYLGYFTNYVYSAAIKGKEEGTTVAFCKEIDFVGGSQTLTSSGLNCTLTSTAGSGGGDVESVGDCTGGACFGGATGTTLSSNTDLIMDVDEDNNGTESFQIKDGGDTTYFEATEGGAISIGDGSTGDTTITVNGDGGTDGTITWDVSDDDFDFNKRITTDGVAAKPPTTVTVCANNALGNEACDYVADGTADDVQIQAAIDAIQAVGDKYGEVFLTEGTFTLAVPVVFGGAAVPFVRLGIKCSIGGTTITAANTFTGNNLFEFTEAAIDPAAAVLFENCFMGGNNSNVTIGAIDSKVGGANNVPIWDLHLIRTVMFSFGSDAVTLDNPWGFVCENCEIEDSDECGIVITQGGTGVGNAKTNGAQIQGAKIIQVGQDASPTCLDAVKISGVNRTRIIGSELGTEATGGYAVNLISAKQTIISGNDIGSGDTSPTPPQGGVHMDGSSNINIVADNVFKNLAGKGILIDSSATGNQIIGNTFEAITGTEIDNSGTVTGTIFNKGDDDATNETNLYIPDDSYLGRALTAPNAGLALEAAGTSASGTGSLVIKDSAGTSVLGLDIDGLIRTTTRFQAGSLTPASATCMSVDSDRIYGDLDCDGTKDAGEDYLDTADLSDLDDVGSSTQGAGRLIISDGTSFHSIAMSGDGTVTSDGVLTITNNAIGTNEIDFISSSTVGAGRLLINDGVDGFDSIAMSGDAKIDSSGAVDLKRIVTIWVLDDSEDTAIKDGSGDVLWRVPVALNGYNLTDVECYVQTAGTTGTTDIQVHNVTQTADMLSTKCTIDSTETDSNTAAAAPVIDTANDDVATADKIRIDVDDISTTAAKGLGVELTFELP